jgi:hypothetical protein
MKKTSLFILGVTALAFSRTMFAFFNDPEGPNLLIVVVAAAIVWAVSLVPYFYAGAKQQEFKKLLIGVFIQILLVAGAYLFLR